MQQGGPDVLDIAVPASPASSPYGQEVCSGDSTDIPWFDPTGTMQDSALHSVGTVPNMPPPSSATYPAAVGDAFGIGPEAQVQADLAAGGNGWGRPSPVPSSSCVRRRPSPSPSSSFSLPSELPPAELPLSKRPSESLPHGVARPCRYVAAVRRPERRGPVPCGLPPPLACRGWRADRRDAAQHRASLTGKEGGRNSPGAAQGAANIAPV